MIEYTRSETVLLEKMFYEDLKEEERYKDNSIYVLLCENYADPMLFHKALIGWCIREKPNATYESYCLLAQRLMYEEPLEKMPLFINDSRLPIIARWRLKIGK